MITTAKVIALVAAPMNYPLFFNPTSESYELEPNISSDVHESYIDHIFAIDESQVVESPECAPDVKLYCPTRRILNCLAHAETLTEACKLRIEQLIPENCRKQLQRFACQKSDLPRLSCLAHQMHILTPLCRDDIETARSRAVTTRWQCSVSVADCKGEIWSDGKCCWRAQQRGSPLFFMLFLIMLVLLFLRYGGVKIPHRYASMMPAVSFNPMRRKRDVAYGAMNDDMIALNAML